MLNIKKVNQKSFYISKEVLIIVTDKTKIPSLRQNLNWILYWSVIEFNVKKLSI